MKDISILFILLLGIFWGCTKDPINEPQMDQIVIRAYLYANEPVSDIQITGTVPIGDENLTPSPINRAIVYLVKSGIKYTLQPSSGDSGYYHYAGNDLTINSGDIFEIYAEYSGQIAYGSTEVPPAPKNLIFTQDTLFLSTSSAGVPPVRFDSVRMEVKWDSIPNAEYFIVIENVETNPEAISTLGPTGRGPNRFLSQPISQNYYRINRMNLSYYGKHRIKVNRINQEYADLYRSRQQDSRDLNEPLTNIKNGLGVFSAFNSIEGYFYIIKN